MGRGEAVRVVEVVRIDVDAHADEEGNQAGDNEGLARQVALSPVNLLWWVGVEFALNITSTIVSQTSQKQSI